MSKSTNDPQPIPDATHDTPTKPPVRALCCQCGQLNTFPTDQPSPKGGLQVHGEAHPVDPNTGIMPADDDTAGWARCVIQRRCPNCREHTTHAVLRGDPRYRDSLERTHRQRCEQGVRYDPRRPETHNVGYCTYCKPGIEEWVADTRVWNARRAGA